MLLRLDGLAKHFGPRVLFHGVDLEVRAGDRVGLIGPNGVGKTTLLRIAAGDDTPDAGRRVLARGCRVALLRQEIDPSLDRTVREETGVALAHLDRLEAELRDAEGWIAQVGRDGLEVPAGLAERYDRAKSAFELAGGFERESRIDRVLAGLGFDEEARGRALRTFSGGWLMRVELAKLLLSEPDVLLLDEPTNHLDLPSIQWFEETLEAFRGAVIVVSHDRTFLRRHIRRVAELEPSGFTVYEHPYDRYLEERDLRREQLVARKRNQDRQVAQTEKFIERFRYKNTKARQVQSRVKKLAKLDRVELMPERQRGMRLRIPPAPRSGIVVCELRDIHKRYGDTRVYEGIDLQIERAQRVALVGPNGAGKSTLLRIIAGTLEVDAGDRKLGQNVRPAFYAQHQLEALDPKRSVLEEIETVAQLDDHPRLRGHLGAFLFSGDDVKKKVTVLSGGEKARLALAKMLLRPSNLLVLDEPTNHLDVQAREILEDALRQYTGTLVFISHDRAFINALSNRVVEVKDGKLESHSGNYDDFMRRREPKPSGVAKEPANPPHAGDRESAKAERQRERSERRARDRIQRRLETLEARILERERQVEGLGWKLGDPAIASDAARLQEIDAERAALREGIAGLYGEWERLAARLEDDESDAE